MQVTLPSAFSTAIKSPSRSERYAHVNTEQAIARIQEQGWKIHAASNVVPRRLNGKKPVRDLSYVKHQVELRHPDHKTVAGAIPRLLFVNSHDGSSSAQCLAGLFRFVCSNGLVVGNTVGAFKLRHTGDVSEELPYMLKEIGKRVHDAQRAAESWSRIKLDNAKANKFAEYASLLRWGDSDRFALSELLRVRRAEDDGNDLWSVFNRVQENTTLGGLAGRGFSGRNMTSMPITGIDRTNTYNADLWELAEEFAK